MNLIVKFMIEITEVCYKKNQKWAKKGTDYTKICPYSL